MDLKIAVEILLDLMLLNILVLAEPMVFEVEFGAVERRAWYYQW